MPTRIPVLAATLLTPQHQAQIAALYELVYAPTLAERAQALAEQGPRFQVVLTVGATGLSAAEMARMPALELVCALGAGYENIDVAAARARGIVVANGAGTNEHCVADHTLGLLIGTVRGLHRLDRLCREGVWRDQIALPVGLTGKRVGIFGLGAIGRQIARRAEAFNMEVGYHNRQPREGVPYPYFDSLLALAQWCDVLVCATPGGAHTRHAVNAEVLDALGPNGYLVNIARGSGVDTQALTDALQGGRLAGAGLDVYESEPEPPMALIDSDKVLLSPHVAGWSPEAVQASVDRFLANVAGHFSGQGPLSVV